jgi:hypothetical protein
MHRLRGGTKPEAKIERGGSRVPRHGTALGRHRRLVGNPRGTSPTVRHPFSHGGI